MSRQATVAASALLTHDNQLKIKDYIHPVRARVKTP